MTVIFLCFKICHKQTDILLAIFMFKSWMLRFSNDRNLIPMYFSKSEYTAKFKRVKEWEMEGVTKLDSGMAGFL